MRHPVPTTLSWIQVRDAIADPSAWRRGRIVDVEAMHVAVVPEDGPGAGEAILLESRRAPQIDVTRAELGMAHPDGGHLTLWSAAARIVAVPLAPLCECGPAEVVIDRRAVIGQRPVTTPQKPHRFELIAEDGTWTCALFTAVDTDAVARRAAAEVDARRRAEAEAAERAARRPDRTVLGRWLRSSLMTDDR